MEVKYCKYCGEPFLPKLKKQFMCGDNECLKAYKREKWAERHPRIEGAEGRRKYDIPERICIICGQVYKPRSVLKRLAVPQSVRRRTLGEKNKNVITETKKRNGKREPNRTNGGKPSTNWSKKKAGDTARYKLKKHWQWWNQSS